MSATSGPASLPYVFVSYASHDREMVLPIVKWLEEAGVQVWIDRTGITGGSNYARRIADANEHCATILIICSRSSLGSRNVKQEIALGWRFERPYLPLYLEPVTLPNDVAYWLEGAQWIDLPDPTDRSQLQRVLQALWTLGIPQPAQAQSHDEMSRPEGLFVGRDREIAEIRGYLSRMFAGHGQVLLLAGDAGAGKTRLAEELAAVSRQMGAAVYWGNCHNWDGTPAFWPWVEVLRRYCESRDVTEVMTAVGSIAPFILSLLPELRAKLPSLGETPTVEPDQARFLLMDGVRRLLRHASSHQALVLIIEDLHLADPGSLQLLTFVARDVGDVRLLIVGTYRDTEVQRDHLLNQTLGELARLNSMHRLALGGLTPEDVAQYIERLSGHAAFPSAVQALWGETEGNPFFFTEFVRQLQSEGRLDTLGGEATQSLAIPESVRQMIRQRLNQLPDVCRNLLSVASVIGRDFGLLLLARATDVPMEGLPGTFDVAIAGRLIQESGQVGVYRFRHALIQETLYGDLPSAQRMQIHAEVGTALEEMRAADLSSVLPELARHFVAAAPLGTAPRAIDYSIKAAEQAAGQTAWETAVAQYESALQLMNNIRGDDQDLRCDVLLALGAVQQAMDYAYGNSPLMRDTYARAADTARRIGSPERFARAALGFAGPNPMNAFGGADQIHLCEEALETLDSGDSPLRAKLLARLAADLRLVPDDSGRPTRLSDDAVNMARRLADPSALNFSLLCRQVVQWTPDNADHRLADIAEILQQTVVPRDLHTMFLASLFKTATLVELGDMREARAAYDPYLGALAETGLPTTPVDGIHAMWVLADGRFAQAEELLSRHLAALRRPAGQVRPLFFLRGEQGRLLELEPIIDEGMRTDTGKNLGARSYPLLRVLFYAETGREARARAEFEVIAREGFTDIAKDMGWFSTVALLADACTALRDVDRARILYGLLTPYEVRFLAYVPFYTLHGAGSYYLGLLAMMLENFPAAEQHLDQALTVHQRAGVVPLVAYTQYARADMMARRGAEGDRAQALELLDQAGGTATSLGMNRLETKISVVRQRLR